ncbi:hypothetical protein ZWY2020_010845 [Hordeum vulgare]|nr:hypothetical protein ZWY2020_010845 [Hordeum vulgare]
MPVRTSSQSRHRPLPALAASSFDARAYITVAPECHPPASRARRQGIARRAVILCPRLQRPSPSPIARSTCSAAAHAITVSCRLPFPRGTPPPCAIIVASLPLRHNAASSSPWSLGS